MIGVFFMSSSKEDARPGAKAKEPAAAQAPGPAPIPEASAATTPVAPAPGPAPVPAVTPEKAPATPEEASKKKPESFSEKENERKVGAEWAKALMDLIDNMVDMMNDLKKDKVLTAGFNTVMQKLMDVGKEILALPPDSSQQARDNVENKAAGVIAEATEFAKEPTMVRMPDTAGGRPGAMPPEIAKEYTRVAIPAPAAGAGESAAPAAPALGGHNED